ncbi:MAG: MBL fold metallo-hydrolase [Bacilli bacterium]|nr:MBL fold metallo-hydrolase [Bacilli bacterium]
MYELNKVGKRTYYIASPSNVGVYNYQDNKICLIDSGNDKDAAKKIYEVIEENNWDLKYIINTHSHADHIGGNAYLQENTNCQIYSSNLEKVFIENTILEPVSLYGGYPNNELENKFLMAKKSKTDNIELPQGLEIISLKGHSFDMIGIKTSDDVYFLGDSLFSIDTINKYHVAFIYDIKEFLSTLNYLKAIKGNLFILSHNEPLNNLAELIEINERKVVEIVNNILKIVKNPTTFEDILKEIFNIYNLHMNMLQYILVGSTIKSYISYLKNISKISYKTEDNKLLWETNL